MRTRGLIAGAIVLGWCSLALLAQTQYPVDPTTGRAIGAKEMSPKELIDKMHQGDVVVIDVREPDSFEKETLPGAINIPIGQLPERLAEFSKDKVLVFT